MPVQLGKRELPLVRMGQVIDQAGRSGPGQAASGAGPQFRSAAALSMLTGWPSPSMVW